MRVGTIVKPKLAADFVGTIVVGVVIGSDGILIDVCEFQTSLVGRSGARHIISFTTYRPDQLLVLGTQEEFNSTAA